MTTDTPPCIADDEGRPCHREAAVLRPVALCHPHRIEIALTVVPDLLRDGLEAALTSVATPVAVRDDLVATATATPVENLLHGVHDSVVYFIANGGRVKIGFTTNLKSRLAALALRSDSVLLALHGGPELERALHARFVKYRNGNTEWFEMAPEVFRYASSRNAATGATPLGQRGIADERPTLASLVRDQVAAVEDNATAVRNVLAARPDANKESVAASVRRERKKAGPYL
jgi:hypothetical protein